MNRALGIFIALILFTGHALAHSQSYGFLNIDTAKHEGSLALAVRDLDTLFALDANKDGKITWGELRVREADVAGGALQGISIGSCALTAAPLLIDKRGGESYAVIPFAAPCSDFSKIGYHLLFDIDAQHRGLVTIDGAQNFVMTPETQEASASSGALSFVGHGIHHIWSGTDHILFLLTLLLGTVIQARGLMEAVKVVTAFTLSHSITLGLAAFGVLNIPVALAESAIAATIVIAALNNIWPLLTARLWILALAFGLVHGIGFANVLADLGLSRDELLVPLLAFNGGVELGQLAIVLAAYPLLLAIANLAQAPRLTTAANLGIASIGAVWFTTRAFGI